MSSPRNAENPSVRISAFFAKSLIQVTHLDRASGARDADMLKIKPGTGPGFRRRRVPAPSGSGACNPVRLRRYRGPGGWRWTGHSPTGSGPEGSSPNELRFGSLVNLLPLRRLVHAWERGRPARPLKPRGGRDARRPARGLMSEAHAAGPLAEPRLDLGATPGPQGAGYRVRAR